MRQQWFPEHNKDHRVDWVNNGRSDDILKGKVTRGSKSIKKLIEEEIEQDSTMTRAQKDNRRQFYNIK